MQQQANLVRARPLPRTEDLRFDLLLAAVPTTTAPEATEQKSNRLLSGETPGACNRTPRTRWSTISEDGLERPGETSTGKASPKSKDGNTAANGYSSIGHHRGSTQPPTVPPPKSLPETTSNPNPTHISPFREIHRIDAAAVRHDQITAIADDYIRRGIPLLVSNVTSSWGRFATESQGVSSIESKMDWDQSLLSLDWMVEKMGGTVLQVRDVAAGRDTPRTVSEFVDYIRRRSSVMGKGTSDLDPMTLTAESNRVGESSHSLTVSGEQRSQKVMSSAHSVDEPLLYGKDILCPPEWTEYLNNHLPEYFQYKGPNDLVTALPKRLQPDNLMVYIGVDKTHTPAHTDICGAVGHNIMLWAEPNSTSFWFIAASGDEHKFAKLCSQNGGSLHTDSYVCPVDVLATADFPLYVAEQRPGDFIIVPPNCPHQVVNKGGITMKAAWNRMTLSALETCFSQVLPVYRLYFKQEVYRIKTVIHRLLHYMANLATVRLGRDSGTTTYEQFPPSTILSRLPNPVFLQEFLRALSLYRASLKDEWIDERFAEQTLHLSSITALPSRFAMAPDQIERYADASTSPHCRSCNICRADIWNRGYTCKLCAASQDESDEEFDACLYCYAHGRSCKHGVENLVMCEYFPMPQLLAELEEAVSTFEELRRSAAASGDEDQIPGPCLIECDLNNDHGGNYSVASIARYRERIRQIGLSTSCHACKSSKNLA
ncbi:hypothetical protein BJ742DRAFT_535669 [Cladochytrium replicatum]|nr:hypothetical protein BJ742DRAFT_535669 [Cladochytrium replicatum]